MISILIPVYNRKNVIAATIQSACRQTLHNIEIVIVDNQSTDGTWEIIEAYQKKDTRIKAFRNATNLGPVYNWKACIDHAQGLYAKILWSDDLISPNFLEKTVPILESRPDIGFVYTHATTFHETVGDIQSNSTLGDSGIFQTEHYINAVFSGGSFPYSPGNGLFRLRDLHTGLIPIIPNNVQSNSSQNGIGPDLLLYLNTCLHYPYFAIIAEPLAHFREHKESISIQSGEKKLTHHYNLAKAHFAETHRPDLIPRMNTQLLLALFRCKEAKKWGFSHISDFYTNGPHRGLDWSFLLRRTIQTIRHRFLS